MCVGLTSHVALVGDKCALIEAGHTPFETGPDSHVCDVSFPKICSAVSPIRWVVIILFGVMSWAL